LVGDTIGDGDTYTEPEITDVVDTLGVYVGDPGVSVPVDQDDLEIEYELDVLSVFIKDTVYVANPEFVPLTIGVIVEYIELEITPVLEILVVYVTVPGVRVAVGHEVAEIEYDDDTVRVFIPLVVYVANPDDVGLTSGDKDSTAESERLIVFVTEVV